MRIKCICTLFGCYVPLRIQMKIIVLFTIIFLSLSTYGCDCNTYLRYERADIVLSGQVIRVDWATNSVRFKIIELVKGNYLLDTIDIVVPCSQPMCCGVQFIEDEKYYLYVYIKEDSTYHTHQCTNTTSFKRFEKIKNNNFKYFERLKEIESLFKNNNTGTDQKDKETSRE